MSLTWQLLPPLFKKSFQPFILSFVFHEKHSHFVLLKEGAFCLETSSGTCTGSY